jgi:hypothetical protein|tara:strand:- start:276 stop:1334 length:1059 start_codon:yes stop_codon:yes gene_type:complete
MSQTKAQLLNPLGGDINITGVVTATSLVGTGFTQGSDGINVTGVVTATSFSGDGGGLTGVASTDNITTSTRARFLNNISVSGVSTLGSAVTVGGSGVHVTGVVTATTFKGAVQGNVTGDVTGTADLASGLTGTPNIAISNLTGVAATFTGNVTIGGTISYEDVTNVDSLGIITARSGIEVSGIVTARTGFAVTYYGDGSNLTGVVSGIALSEAGAARGTEITTINFASGATITNTGAGATISISTGVTTEAISGTSGITTHINLDDATDHEITVSGVTTISCRGGTKGSSHIVRIINSGISTVGFSTFFLFPSGATPTIAEADGTLSLVSFTVHRVGAAGTQLMATSATSFS